MGGLQFDIDFLQTVILCPRKRVGLGVLFESTPALLGMQHDAARQIDIARI